MSDNPKGVQNVAEAAAPKGAPPSQGNPAFRMMGLPRLRAKLPSRNWTIFLTVVGSFSAAVIYDRRQKRAAQQHWCNAVSHLSREQMESSQLPRKLTVYLSAPPGDGLRPSREFFVEYIKPMLVAAAVDWEVVEGRKEGDVRAALAKKIRKSRVRNGESTSEDLEESAEDIIADMRQNSGVQPADSRGGDIVVGRHTWKEYIRGLHEGWLGPLAAPLDTEAGIQEASTTDMPQNTDASFTESAGENLSPSANTSHDATQISNDDPLAISDDKEVFVAAENASKPTDQDAQKNEADTKPKPKPSPAPPYILPPSYPSAEIAPTAPSTFAPSSPITQPHLLGFFNTPIRIYRFLTRRHVADSVGKQVATLLLADGSRQYHSPLAESSDAFASNMSATELSSSERDESANTMWEPQSVLIKEEADWHKTARQPNKEGEEKERPWKEPMVLDNRVVERMRMPDATTLPLSGSNATAEQGTESYEEQPEKDKGHYREWKGGADPVLRKTSWGKWFIEATGFEDTREPRGEGAKDGLVGDEV